MSLYNTINGFTSATFFVLPMLGKHPDEYPRFRDCFISDEDHPEYNDHIHVYTRTGGGNRDDYFELNETMQNMDGFITDYDDTVDCTYASWIFEVPEKYESDFLKFKEGDIKGFSEEYKAELRKIFPKLEEKFDEIFGV